MSDFSPQQKTEQESDARSPLAIGYMWATVVITMGIELALPVLLGAYLDFKLGTVCLFIILGVFLGFFIMVINFIKLMKSKAFQQKAPRQRQ